MFLTKFIDEYEVCCNGINMRYVAMATDAASAPPVSFNARYLILKSKKISNDQELIQSDPTS